ncbi:hypothetical protein PSTT_04625 [Puccinia striiformis]|uniref:Uncharacterized protein n=1 Tax=Puccinia striiformis TaxID=27350 RepID=A0A2S4VS33_9BASI|nr:hypothetical protein PSTT_04625 [Puccinia striiformis]
MCWDTNSGDPNPTHKVKRRRGSKPAAARVTTAAIQNLRLPSPQSLLDRITDNTIDHSTQEADPNLSDEVFNTIIQHKKQTQASTDKVFRKETVNSTQLHRNVSYRKSKDELQVHLKYYSFYRILSLSSFVSVIYPSSTLSQHSWPFPSSVFLKRFSRGPRTALSYSNEKHS